MGILDCFLTEAIPVGGLAQYDFEPQRRIWFIQQENEKVWIRTNKVTGRKFIIPTVDVMEVNEQRMEDFAAGLILEAARWYPTVNSIEEAAHDATLQFGRRDLPMFKVLTSADHPFFSPGLAFAMTKPEFVGRRVFTAGGCAVGLALINRRSFLAYRIRSYRESRLWQHGEQISTQGFLFPVY